MKKVIPVIQGYRAIEIGLVDSLTDQAVNLTGYTGFSAKAQSTTTGTVIGASSTLVSAATSGRVRIEFDFTEPGTYQVQICCTDTSGMEQIWPDEAGQLLVKVSEKI